ncbi:DUF6612 family protein [Halobacillus sp. BBL2006]|uniref:DUF6612 family protein n=1 Tax=Halobacillus sp. BBL2006 TaxID=1543706 RepID=UPI000541A16A|nr:DUF6612 family protein [Halobacillus sp. BBL2006]KHE68247.1 hypothetical protein LD39_14980 [Halobacillus sp. BBL2006]
MKKKLTLAISILMMLLFISACSSTEGAKIEEVYTKSAEATENLKSFAMKMETEQVVKMGEESTDSEANSPVPTGVPITSTIDSEMNVEPLAFHQTVKTMGQEMEQYYSNDGLYMTMPSKEGWFKAPKELTEQLNSLSAQEQTPGSQLESLKEYIDEFNLETEDSNYILTLTSEGENVQKLFEEAMKKTMPEGQIPEEMMKGLTVNKLSYKFVIDKESYYPQTMDIKMDYTFDQNGQQMEIQQNINGQYSKFNEVGEIIIPQDIKDGAKEIEGAESLFQS